MITSDHFSRADGTFVIIFFFNAQAHTFLNLSPRLDLLRFLWLVLHTAKAAGNTLKFYYKHSIQSGWSAVTVKIWTMIKNSFNYYPLNLLFVPFSIIYLRSSRYILEDWEIDRSGFVTKKVGTAPRIRTSFVSFLYNITR